MALCGALLSSASSTKFCVLKSSCELISCEAFTCLSACVYPAVEKRRNETEMCPAVDWKEPSELIDPSHLETPSHFPRKSLHLPVTEETTYLLHSVFSSCCKPSLLAPTPRREKAPFALLFNSQATLFATLFTIKAITDFTSIFCALLSGPTTSRFSTV